MSRDHTIFGISLFEMHRNYRITGPAMRGVDGLVGVSGAHPPPRAESKGK